MAGKFHSKSKEQNVFFCQKSIRPQNVFPMHRSNAVSITLPKPFAGKTEKSLLTFWEVKKFFLRKTIFSSEHFSGHVNFNFDDPAVILFSEINEKLLSNPIECRKFFIPKKSICPQKDSLDTYNVVLTTLPEKICHKSEIFCPKSEIEQNLVFTVKISICPLKVLLDMKKPVLITLPENPRRALKSGKEQKFFFCKICFPPKHSFGLADFSFDKPAENLWPEDCKLFTRNRGTNRRYIFRESPCPQIVSMDT